MTKRRPQGPLVTKGITHRNSDSRRIEVVQFSTFTLPLSTALQFVANDFHVLPAPPRSGFENRAGLRNVVQNLIQLCAEEAPISPHGAYLLR